MRIAIFGAGATGGFIAFRLAEAGHKVSVIARGAHLEAMRRGGLQVESEGEIARAEVRACADAAEAGPQDVVIVAVKATGLAAVQGRLGPMLGPETAVLFPQNGMPWWYPIGLTPGLPLPDLPIFALGKAFLAEIAPERVFGGLLYSANAVTEPGVVRNESPKSNGIDIGPLVPGDTRVAGPVRQLLDEAGFSGTVSEDIRAQVWAKLVANMTGSLLALAVQSTSSVVRRDPALGAVYLAIAREAIAVAGASGFPVTVTPEAMLARTLDHKPSILQDYEAGRPMEIAEIALAPQAFARAAGVPTPAFDVLAAIVTRMARDRGLA